ncbi:helix-turn-helix domain-containing protein [Microtetraspora sp. NBRC 16547]|uniref:TetR/AcrR family transcriptional regulator n=1 Tax=Microtetraspora sp. NBRC 16547 TaxID=3030993 RepID=UPI0024A006AC|nr:helix-turn-helix domain-containing protein [Microtetraspora sp. NBRC 16547]GLW99664.1 TetR family transcriptional regulator [Microtetraspora sp. NBRC 16547]
MGEPMGLRERKKLQTRHAIFRAAVELFHERGFDDVSVAEIAEKADVSKMTVFNYFRTKEDIVLGSMEEHLADPAVIAAERSPGESVVAAFRRVFLERLAARAPETGLNDDPALLKVINLVKGSPSLAARLYLFSLRGEQLLAAALAGREPGSHDIRETVDPATISELRESGPVDLRARVAASQIMSLWRALQSENYSLTLLKGSADEAYPDAVAAAELGFGMLERGLGDYGVR